MAAVSAERLHLVRQKAAQWADALIDFTPSNTLLYYKDTQTRTVDLTTCDPETLRLLLTGRRCRLAQLLADAEALSAANARMRNIYRQIVASAEEQGVSVGRLARGLIRIPPPPGRGSYPVRALQAPLLLHPLKIETRNPAENDYFITLDGEPELNQVLLLALQRDHGISFEMEAMLRQLSETLEEADPNLQVRAVYDVIHTALASEGRAAELEPRTVIGCFSFEKLPMVQDLRNSADLLAEHDVIAAAAGDQSAKEGLQLSTGESRIPEPDDIDPDDEFLVLDADLSQHRAALAVASGRHVVIQGPPGTGKSQTIANIIAASAAAGRSVLFVAEKRAAIEAVTDLLAKVDLQDLVFDLHDRQQSKGEVAAQIAASLDQLASAMPPNVESLHRRLVDTRRELLQHTGEMHRHRYPWGISAYDVQVALLEIPPTARTKLRFRRATLERLDVSTIDKLGRQLSLFVNNGGLTVRRGESAWSRAAVRTTEEAERVRDSLDAATGEQWRDRQRAMLDLVERSGLRTPQSLAGWRELLDLLAGVERTVALHGPEVFSDDLDRLCSAVGDRAWRAKSPTPDGWWRRWQLRRAAMGRRKRGPCSRQMLFEELHVAARQLSQWYQFAIGPDAAPQVIHVGDEYRHFSSLRDDIVAVAMVANLGELDALPVDELQSRLGKLSAERRTLLRLPELARITDLLSGYGVGPVLDELTRRNSDAEEAQVVLRYCWMSSLLDQFQLDSPILASFSGRQHDSIVSEFAELDAKHLELNAARIRRRAAEKLRDALDLHPKQRQLVVREANKKRRHLSVRSLVANAPDVLLAARPCWAMSPIVVSRLLPPRQLFHLVVFDEASQVEPIDAMTSIMRGRQLVVAGDVKQLPPSTDWRSTAGEEFDDDEDEDTLVPARLTDFESILTCLAEFVSTSVDLLWHYRSEDERLIAFSNQHFYNRRLITFPGLNRQAPVSLYVVEGRAKPGSGGLADAELSQVLELVVAHVHEHPTESLGIITANVGHRDAVEEAIHAAAVVHPELAEFRKRMDGPRRRLFVKSLEMVQGDERDAIVFTIGRAKNADGRLSMNLGKLNRDGGERRLNVAVTRARRRMHVVSSFTHEDVPPNYHRQGPKLLREFLETVATGAAPQDVGRASSARMNALEYAVLEALEERDIPVTPQWGVSGYRIDFALRDPDRDGRMVLAVEVDGDRYHRLDSARDRDRLRQEQLERMGWQFHRIWASEWFADPEREADRIEQHWKDVLTAPVTRPAQPKAHRSEETGTTFEPIRALPRPHVEPGQRIDQYTDLEIDAVAEYILSDGLACDRATRLRELWMELGFERAGSRIVARCTAALDRVQPRMGEVP